MRINLLPKRILIADDQFYSLAGLKLALENLPGTFVCGEATDGITLIEKCAELLPDIIITDLKMPGITGMEAISIISTVHPAVKTLAWTQYIDEDLFREAIKAGANGFIYKTADGPEIAYAIEQVMQDNIYYCGKTSKMISGMVRGSGLDNQIKPLPPNFFAAHEREILELMCKELNTRQIAVQLGLRPMSVNKYRSNLKFKTGAITISGLVLFALEHGIVKREDISQKILTHSGNR